MPFKATRPLSVWISVLSMLAVLALTAGCAEKPKMRSPRVPVTVARAQERDVPFEIVSSGTVEARQTTAVNAQVGGQLVRIGFHEGDEVQAGQLLFQIDPQPFRAALAQARANLARDRVQYENSRLQAERSQKLVAQQFISQEEAEQAASTAEALHATLHADSAAAANAELNLKYASVRAQFTGRTGNLHVHVGDLVKANDTGNPLVTLNQIRPILVRFAIPGQQLPLVMQHWSEALPVSVGSTDSTMGRAVGRLVFVDNAVDGATGTVMLKAEFPNSKGTLWPGQFVDARLTVYSQKGACVVPAQAVTTSATTGTYVYVLNADTTVAVRPVTVLRNSGNLAVISAGLKKGETVVTDGQLRLAPGSKVSLKNGAKMGLEANS